MFSYDNDMLNAAITRIASTEDGQIFFNALKNTCHWDDILMASDEPQITQYYAARRGVYGGIRKLIKPEYLKKIEFDYQEKEDKSYGIRTNVTTERFSKLKQPKSSAATRPAESADID
jgi:hypothetical protein